MSEPRAIQADYANWRPVAGRKVLQLVFEVPIEQTEQVLKMLGVPMPGESKWCAIALLDPKEPEPQPQEAEGRAVGGHARAAALSPERRSEIATQGAEARWGKDRKRFADMPLSQQAALRCQDNDFKLFLNASNAEDAALKVREYCGTNSRSFIIKGAPVGDAWERLEGEYQAWLTTQRYAEMRRG